MSLRFFSRLFYFFLPNYGQIHEKGIINTPSLQGVALLILISLLIPTCDLVSISISSSCGFHVRKLTIQLPHSSVLFS